MGRYIAALLSAAFLAAPATSAVAGAAEDEATTRAANDTRFDPLSGPVSLASPHGGVAVFEVDAEAGLHPRRPRTDDQKVSTDEGHAYWVRAKPGLLVEVIDVGLAEDGRKVWLRVSDETAAHFNEFTSKHVGHLYALVLNGRMVGEPIEINMPIVGSKWDLPESNRGAAYFRCLGFERGSARWAREQTSAASNCQLRLDHGG